ncbi:MAG: hypothetical protein F6K24_45780, partial [Okeania sp. SIO2D1]|nr:hypothetical protein [Okeania sp. SIO2D1]
EERVRGFQGCGVHFGDGEMGRGGEGERGRWGDGGMGGWGDREIFGNG